MRVAHVSRARDNNEIIAVRYERDDDEAYEMRDTDESFCLAASTAPTQALGSNRQNGSSVSREIEQAKRDEFEKALKAIERQYARKGAQREKPLNPIIA